MNKTTAQGTYGLVKERMAVMTARWQTTAGTGKDQAAPALLARNPPGLEGREGFPGGMAFGESSGGFLGVKLGHRRAQVEDAQRPGGIRGRGEWPSLVGARGEGWEGAGVPGQPQVLAGIGICVLAAAGKRTQPSGLWAGHWIGEPRD